MYRLLNTKNIYPFQSYPISNNNILISKSIFELKCSFCQKILRTHSLTENMYQIRHQSTRMANALHQKIQMKRVKYKNYKKYGEVLEVGGKAMTEAKVSISKLNAHYLSKLTSSSISLGQLHQLKTSTMKKKPNTPDVDPELLQSVKNKILNKKSDKHVQNYDECALIFTSHKISNIENKLKIKETLDVVKQSYYNFRKETLYDQKLTNLRFAITEGIDQEFNVNAPLSIVENQAKDENDTIEPQKGAHAIFREIFFDNSLDNYGHELITHLTGLQSTGFSHATVDEMLEEISHNEMADAHDDSYHEPTESEINVKALKIKKLKKQVKAKKKARREKERAEKELNMKTEMAAIEKVARHEHFQNRLHTHVTLLCSLGMLKEVRHILQYYRSRSPRVQGPEKISDNKIYNTVLHGFASEALYNNSVELFTSMEEDNIEMNAQTFAAMFECVERSQLANKSGILNKYYEKMQEKNISLHDLFNKAKFLKDQREVVLKAIRIIKPHFEPVYSPPELNYVCPLLKKLNIDEVAGIRDGFNVSPAKGIMTLEELKARAKKQLEVEIKGEIEIKNIDVKDELSDTVKIYRKKLQDTENEWRGVIKEAMIRNLNTLQSQCSASQNPITLYPYLTVLDVDQFVELLMSEISKLVDGSESYSPTLKLLQRDLGTQVYNRYQIEQYRHNGILKKTEEIFDKYCEWYLNRHSLDGQNVPYNCRQAWQVLLHQNREGASLDIEETPWSIDIRQNIGKFLYNIIIHDIKIDVNMFKQGNNVKPKKLPGVYKVHRPWGRMVRLELKPHPQLARLWLAAARPALRMRAPLLPALAPAAVCAHARSSPALLAAAAAPLVRLPFNVQQQLKRLEEVPPATLYPVLDSLNQLGEVPWVINKPILDLQLQVFRSGGNKKLDIPQPPSALDTSQFGKTEDKAGAFRRRIAINRARAEMYSLWCDALYKLSLANHYREETFWLPHNMDFRGRVYAVPPHMSQLGADGARALLRFAARRPLGRRGLRWLRLHAVNLTGAVKRLTLHQRLEYAEKMLPKMLDSADHPLDGEMWWAESEEPWQTLACCMEIANAIRSPNPEEYESGFPVHQDGSCNGLQHYAALGRDSAGAAAVNLAPGLGPMDVYSAVAARVEEMRAKDAEKGVLPAMVLEKFVRRKVIKQTVMTTVYGVTKFGARLQIAKQLKDIEEFPKEQVWACSQYLTARTFDSLQSMFTSTKLIQDWFTDCAKAISGVCGESVEWRTPLGLPVLQPYFKRPSPSACACACAQHHQRPCTMKQKNAFPPNFIHSLDSSHMMLTALWCQAQGVTFVSVHDCFWTHPASVDLMNKICREQFVALHSQPILEDLSKYLVERFGYKDSELDEDKKSYAVRNQVNELLKKVPPKGDFKLENVLKSVYFFS